MAWPVVGQKTSIRMCQPRWQRKRGAYGRVRMIIGSRHAVPIADDAQQENSQHSCAHCHDDEAGSGTSATNSWWNNAGKEAPVDGRAGSHMATDERPGPG